MRALRLGECLASLISSLELWFDDFTFMYLDLYGSSSCLTLGLIETLLIAGLVDGYLTFVILSVLSYFTI